MPASIAIGEENRAGVGAERADQRVRSSSLSFRVFSCFLMMSLLVILDVATAASPVCTCSPMCCW